MVLNYRNVAISLGGRFDQLLENGGRSSLQAGRNIKLHKGRGRDAAFSS